MTISKRTSSATLVKEAVITNLKMRTTDGIVELGDKRKPEGLAILPLAPLTRSVHRPSLSDQLFCLLSPHKRIWLYIFLK